MIVLGANIEKKNQAILDYAKRHEIKKAVLLSPRKFFFSCVYQPSEIVEWADIIEYKDFYRLLQEIDERTLVVVNECLRLQNRYDLTYNCIRHFLNRTSHQIIFQYLPVIDSLEDFMILFDFDTGSRFKREKFRRDLLAETRLEINQISFKFNEIEIESDEKLKRDYLREKEKLISGIGLKDPDTIPRNLYLMSGKAKLGAISNKHSLFEQTQAASYAGRNNRFKIENFQTYKDNSYEFANYTIFEFPHNFIDFSTFAALSGQTRFDVLTTDLKVDKWYLQRYRDWADRLEYAYANLQQK